MIVPILHLKESSSVRKVKQYFGGKLDGALVSSWMKEKKHIIGLVEFFAVVLARYHWNEILKGRRPIFLWTIFL